MTKNQLSSLCVGLSLLVSGVGAQAQTKLNIGGKTVPTNAKKIGGKTYVAIDDVAKALGMKASVSGSTISIKNAGGAYQVANKLKGNIGEDLFSGRWGFKVVSVERGPVYKGRYTNKYNRDLEYDSAEGEEVVAIQCRLKNGTKVKTNFAFAVRDYGENTALTDQDAQSFAPVGYDVFADEPSPLGKSILPAASANFAIVFKVPKGTVLKDLVFTAVVYGERGDNKGTDFRVSLK